MVQEISGNDPRPTIRAEGQGIFFSFNISSNVNLLCLIHTVSYILLILNTKNIAIIFVFWAHKRIQFLFLAGWNLFNNPKTKASANMFKIVIFLQIYATLPSPGVCDIYITQMSELGAMTLIKL